IRSELSPLSTLSAEHAEAIFATLEAKARAELRAENLDPALASFTRELDLRYAGQGYELRISLEGLYRGKLAAEALANVRPRFDERHAQIHGHAAKERAVEVVSYRVRVRVSVPKYEPREEKRGSASADAARKGMRPVHFDSDSIETALYERDRLDVGTGIDGPAIVEQFDATTVVPPGWSARVDPLRNLILEKSR